MENVHPLRLRLLLEVQHRGSISAAAKACSIGQPSASVHLRTLETAFGQRLVTRDGRGSSLTAAGEVIASHAAQVLDALDSMRRGLDALEARNSGQLTIAASLTPSVALIPALLRRFSDQYPGVRVRLRTVTSEAAVMDVARAAADIAIAGEVTTGEDVVRRQIMVDELVGICRPGLLSTDGGWISPGTLARSNLLVGSKGSSTRAATDRYLLRAGCRPPTTLDFDSYETIKHAVAEGLGVSFISRRLVTQDLDRGNLIAFRVSGVGPMNRLIHLVQAGIRRPTPEVSAFIGLLADAEVATDRGTRMTAPLPTSEAAGWETAL